MAAPPPRVSLLRGLASRLMKAGERLRPEWMVLPETSTDEGLSDQPNTVKVYGYGTPVKEV